MAIKARLSLILKANDVVVAESEDPVIWQAAFDAIQRCAVGAGFPGPSQEDGGEEIEWIPAEERMAIAAFAEALDVEVKDVLSACHPRPIAPYIFLNRLHWEAFKRQTPERGRNAVSNAVLAMTLLLLWAERINVGRLSQRDAMAALRTISARDEHAGRAIDNCPWLQRSTGRVLLNADRISDAIAVARAFCLKRAPQMQIEMEEN